MNTTTKTFRIQTRPRLFLGTALLDLVDTHPVLSLASVVLAAALVAARLVLA